jgi:hypothetical protein
MRQDPVNGKRYERPVEAVFEDRRFPPGRKPSRDAQPRGADSPYASGRLFGRAESIGLRYYWLVSSAQS